MSEFNTGRPPLGESGMVFYNEMFKYWDGERFSPGRNCIWNAWSDRGIVAAIQEAPGWRWVSFDEAAERLGLGNEKARKMVHHSHLPAHAGFVPPGEGLWYPEPTQEQVEQTQEPETPTLGANEDVQDANRPMLDNDVLGAWHGKWDRHNARAALKPPTPAPGFMVREIRDGAGLLTEWPADHRLGAGR